MNIEKNLKRYLDTEFLLNGFFDAFNYCMEKCISVEIEKTKRKDVAACCKDRYHCVSDLDHPAYDRLREERQKQYGTPADQINPSSVSPCEYHSFRGCVLSTHKSPICLAFMCRQSIYYLRKTYGIYAYDYLGVYYALEWILTGDLPDRSYKEFRDSLSEMTRKVKMNGIEFKY